ncbi:MAG: J domain-containing protein [Myxococcota bacterium]
MDDPYAILGVGPDASPDEIKRAYRRRAQEWHPDKNPAPDAADRFKQIAAAFEALSNPGRRRSVDARRGAGRSEIPTEFLDDLASAVERAQTWIEGVVVPHYASRFRGVGAEMAARWIRDLPTLGDPMAFSATSTWRGRRRARQWLASVQVRFEPDPWQASTIHLGRRGFVIGLSPIALWTAGFGAAGSAAIDDAVLRLLVTRYAQGFGYRRFVAPSSDAGWDAAVVAARAVDDRVVRSEVGWRVVWGLALALAAFLLYNGWVER